MASLRQNALKGVGLKRSLVCCQSTTNTHSSMSVQGGKAAVGDECQPINSSHQSIAVTAMEQKMREQIRLLQEHRAAVMMEEVIDLQRERDLALGRIKTLKKNMEGEVDIQLTSIGFAIV